MVFRLTLPVCLVLGWARNLRPQSAGPPEQAPCAGSNCTQDSQKDQITTLFPHSPTGRFWFSGQINIIFQAHPAFPAKFSGPNSLKAQSEHATSRVLTLYTGVEVTRTTEVTFDLESSGGRGISDALGLAGFTNLDVVRNPDLGAKPYVARVMIRQIIPLASKGVATEHDPLSLSTSLPERRLELRAGKFSLVDFFDLNAPGSNSHRQFMNWTVDNNGAYDYAADTRGYTYGLMLGYFDRSWSLQFAETLMPKVANGLALQWNLRRARSENTEFVFRQKFVPRHTGTVRLLAFVNHANMGDYREAVSSFLAGKTAVPEVTAHPPVVSTKYGFGANFEQDLGGGFRAFGRWGWNEGRHESFVYTEVNQAMEVGGDLEGSHWHRKLDRVGAALSLNALSGDHRKYLALGGRGFLLGDGALNYGREQIFETYYTLHLWRGVFSSVDLQHINNPGYNRDRGPVWVPALRLHVEM